MLESRKTHIQQRNIEIRAMYKRLASVQEDGVQKYNDKYIMLRICKRFYLEDKTIRKIIKGYV